MSDYDETNRGVIFQPHQDQNFVGQGKINIEGSEAKYALVKEKLSRDGKPQLVLYVRAGVLFDNDKKGNDKAPDLSGPLDLHPDHRVAGWKGEKDGRRYISINVSQKQNGGEGGQEGGSANGDQNPGASSGGWDDEIPF